MEEFITKVTEQLRCARARECVARELSDHITDQADAYEQAGDAHEEAVRKAVREMGDPVAVGVELDRIHRPQADLKMIGMALVFSLAGLFVLYTVGGLSQAPDQFIRQCVILLVSFGVMAGIYFLDYSFIARYAYALYLLMTAVFFVLAKTLPRTYGSVPEMYMLVYLYIPVWAGILYRLRGQGYGAVAWGIGIQFVTASFVRLFSATMHMTLIVHLICLVMLILAIHKGWFAVNRRAAAAVAVGALAIVPAALVMVKIASARGFYLERLRGWLHPTEYANSAGYIYLWIREELAAAKLLGSSGGASFIVDNLIGDTSALIVAEPFIVLRLVCTFGILAGIALIAALLTLIVRAFQIVKRQKNQLGFMISAACFLVFLMNCLDGILINTGYYPVSSMMLPFVSYGAGATLTYAVFIGLLLSIRRNEMIVTDQAVKERQTWKLSIKLERKV